MVTRDVLTSAVLATVQVVVVVTLTPLLVGVMREVRARAEGRAGGRVLQPWRDLRKLLGKEPLSATGTGRASRLAPIGLMVSSLVLAALLPLVATGNLNMVPDDLFVVVSVLLLGSVALALVGLDAGTAFGGMGSSRHMTIAALLEPTVLLAVYALSIPAGTSALSAIVELRVAEPATVISPVSLLALAALAIVIIAETGRLPVDNPSTHLELTMVHEAMVLESSGRDLGWLELGSWLRLSVLLGLLANLTAPWGIALSFSAAEIVLGVAALVLKVLALGTVIAVIEVFLAKVRLFRVPELLAGSFVLAFLAVTASYLVVAA
ncbi:MAG TPA: NADH-quinone oxidoreductase subunit H [Nocardioides sp.]|uniref:respiratory chain complex I subunit 1 family protein n=1 Tax=Nocardioides sp. TaxID=35761 RepID=UPI002B71F5C9|nr:NADH-quinone oxidoreductase subunit H [Nocardioides sp.]HQR25513.1 NADH-quinone oxidoreductase subunit H [Nocardioides sp.]